jgi:AGZA family xanthine/uracil permease-like MFS transporter
MLITGAFAFCMVDMFDTMGTLYGACARGDLLDEKGNVPNLEKCMLADSIATCTGAVLGTSTVTTFVESSAGIAEGGKTGLTSMVVGVLFFFAMFLTPIAKLIPTYATAGALIYVGVLMMNCVTKIDWLDPATAVPAFATIAMTVLTYSISNGIGIGLISYVVIQLCTGKFMKNEDGSVKQSDIVTAIIAGLFLLMFLLTH